MAVLVTGGAGYIGSHTVQVLRDRGEQVVVLDSLETGHCASIGDTPLVKGNIGDRDALQAVFGDYAVDAVIHLAAYKAAGESIAAPAAYFENNVCGTLTLLDAMRRAAVPYLVFSSTCAVYGTPTHVPVAEEDDTHPENPYGESKLIVEQMLKWFGVSHGLRYVSLRYFNAAGAALDGNNGEHAPTALNLIPLVMMVLLGQRPVLRVFGTDYPTPDGTAIRDYVHVVDLADAHVKALEYLRAGRRSGIVNLGTGTGSSVQQIIDATRQITGCPVPVEYAGRRPGDPSSTWASITKAQRLLGWQPRYTIEDIIRTAWQWHSTHPAGFDS